MALRDSKGRFVKKGAVKDTDHGYNRTVKGLFDAGTPRQLLVGIQGVEAAAPEGESQLTVAEVANRHEFGIGVPERSWLRAWFDERRGEIERDLSRVMRRVSEGRLTLDQGLNLLGQKYQAQIQERISNGIPPPNSDATIAAKGSSTPLIDTGQMRSSITYILETMSAEGAA